MQRQHTVHMLRYLGVTMTGRMRKLAATQALEAVYAARRIQRWFRRVTQGNESCPISLEPLRYPYISLRTTRLTFVRYNLVAFHEFLCTHPGGVVREPTTNRPISPRTMRRIVKRLHASGYAVRSVAARHASVSIIECLENVVDTLMTEALDDDASFSDDGFCEWAANMERAVTGLVAHSRSVARLKLEQCTLSCACTPLCAERTLLGMPACTHHATRALLASLAPAATR
jgi:hypothetical protein